MSILRRVENREITPEEGARQIEELERAADAATPVEEAEIGSVIDGVQTEILSALEEAEAEARSAIEEAEKEARRAIEEAEAGARSAMEKAGSALQEFRDGAEPARAEARLESGSARVDAGSATRETTTEAGDTDEETGAEAARAIREALAEARSAIEEATAEAGKAVQEAIAEAQSAVHEAKAEAAKAVQEALADARNAVGEAKTEAARAIREALAEAESALDEARAEAGRAAGDASSESVKRALRVRGTDWIGALNSLFTGLGDALRGNISRSGDDWSGQPRFEFVEVREGTFGVNDPTLDFDHHNGRVAVEAWEHDTYRMEVKKIVHAPDESQAKSRAEASIGVTASPDCLGVRLAGGDTRGIQIAVKVSVPSHLRYKGRFRFHNGSVSVSGLQMAKCDLSMHNGDCRLTRVDAERLSIAMHNGRASLEHTKAQACTVSMHNGEINGDVKTEAITATTHNGRIGVSLSTDSRLESSFSAHNGVIRASLEKADDIGYRVEYRYHAGTARTQDLLSVLDEIQSTKPKNGVGVTTWMGVSPGYDGKPRSISTKCTVHNGEISVGWAS